MSDDRFQLMLLPGTALEQRAVKFKGGYAAPPGTGPEGETCRTCKHYTRAHYHGKVWLKCGLRRGTWTHGPGTDIKARAPACAKWEKGE